MREKKKWKIFVSLDKEEAWLNKQLENGWRFTGITAMGRYKFREVEAVDRDKVIRVDYRKFEKTAPYSDYLQFMEDAGWKHLAGKKDSGTHYYIGSKTNQMELYSDDDSKLERDKRLRKGYAMSMLPLLVIYYVLFEKGSVSAITNPSQFFLTPGLWEKTGSAFTKAFLFELPFAGMRLAVALIFPIVLIFFGLTLAKIQWNISQREKMIKK